MEKSPFSPEMTPVVMRLPSPQSIVDVKSPALESGLASLKRATSPTNAVPAVALARRAGRVVAEGRHDRPRERGRLLRGEGLGVDDEGRVGPRRGHEQGTAGEC